MKTEDVAKVLAKCAAFDNRKPSAAVVLAWQEALHPDMTVEDALMFVSEHYAQTREWVMPADLNRAYRKRRRERLSVAELPAPPQDASAEQFLEFVRTTRRAVAAGQTTEDAAMMGYRRIGVKPQITEKGEQNGYASNR